jgi:hypothetical protein
MTSELQLFKRWIVFWKILVVYITFGRPLLVITIQLLIVIVFFCVLAVWVTSLCTLKSVEISRPKLGFLFLGYSFIGNIFLGFLRFFFFCWWDGTLLILLYTLKKYYLGESYHVLLFATAVFVILKSLKLIYVNLNPEVSPKPSNEEQRLIINLGFMMKILQLSFTNCTNTRPLYWAKWILSLDNLNFHCLGFW